MSTDINKKKYIGISIGPIERILGYAKSTRAIWASSYLFAYLGKQIAGTYFYKGHNRFLKPRITKEMFCQIDGIGRFPDQYIIETDETVAAVRNVCNSILDNLAQNIAKVLNVEQQVDDIAYYLKQVLRIIIIEKTLSLDAEKVVQNLQDTLAIMECRDTYCAEETRNYLADFFESTSTESLLYQDAFGQGRQGRLFETILECSAGEEGRQYRKELLRDDIGKIQNTYQKYITFVSADGDNFGKTMARLNNRVGNVFSEYNRVIRDIVDDYGGQVIYQGGDDILFFAPVYNKGKDIFQLIQCIDATFNRILDNNPDIRQMPLNQKPTLSYGVSISYYKFPMAEAKALSEDLLEEVKNVPKGTLKNKIRWKARKHSGQLFGGMFDKNNLEQFEQCIQLIASSILGKDSYLHSVTHWLNQQKPVLSSILKLDGNIRSIYLDNYVDNCFNEAEHQNFRSFLKAMKNCLLIFPQDKGIDALHRILRYVDLLIKKENV